MSGNSRGGILFGLVIGLIFTVLGYFVTFTFGKPILDQARASVQWPKVPGVITRSVLATSRSKKKKTMYSFDVEYRYEVAGEELVCNNVYFGGDFSSSSSAGANEVVRRYPVGAKVDVAYDPNNPVNAVLEPGAHWQSYILYGIGLAFLVVGVLMFGSSLFYLLAYGVLFGAALTSNLSGSSNDRTF
jgi:hypothetical protein